MSFSHRGPQLPQVRQSMRLGVRPEMHQNHRYSGYIVILEKDRILQLAAPSRNKALGSGRPAVRIHAPVGYQEP